MTRTWPACNEALKRRGALAIWFDPELTREAAPTGRRGRQQTCSDAAIQTCRTVKVLFGMALRQTTGFVENLLRPPGSGWSGYHRRRRVETRLHGAKTAGTSDRQDAELQVRIAVLNGSPRSAYPSRTPWDESVR